MRDYIFLIKLSKIHYELGLIKSEEFNERIKIANWLSNDQANDPRIKVDDNNLRKRDFNNNKNNVIFAETKERCTDKGVTIYDMVTLGKCHWIFTISDPDPYPSVPHGHLNNKNNKWPKLNPYLGKVFKGVKEEDISKRLTKKEMQILWTNSKFKSFCVNMLGWYMEEYTNYTFPEENLERLSEEVMSFPFSP